MNINDILSQATPYIEWTYDKLMTIYVPTPYVKDNGADGIRYEPMSGGADIKCRLSVVNLNNTTSTEATKLREVLKVFCSPDVELKAGSKLKIGDEKYITTTTSEPMVYTTHQEVLVTREEWI